MKRLHLPATFAGVSALVVCVLLLNSCSDKSGSPLSGSDDISSANSSKIVDQLIPQKYRASSADSRPIWETLDQDQVIDDPLLADVLAASDSVYDVYSVRITWGTLSASTDINSPPTNWSGGVGMNAAGFIAVRALIDFEPDQDKLLPRESPTQVRWKSITIHDIDGIHLLIFHPKDVVYIVAPDFIFKTEQATIVVPLFNLEKLDTIVRVDEHNAVALQAHKIMGRECPQGVLAGRWTFKSMTAGHFFGKWISADGQLMGYLGGGFDVTADGAHVFRGKWVDVEGEFQGYLRGRWGYPDTDPSSICLTCSDNYGWFAGKFTDADGVARGALRGRFILGGQNSDVSTDPHGSFFGRWKVDCVIVTDG